ncbi:MAG: hypothetical protein DWQ01_09805 [Planctomycetota bacterium]|nr:MAG: hypothetical protein DWQ01_09805 [Planctomycetota bacterium]
MTGRSHGPELAADLEAFLSERQAWPCRGAVAYGSRRPESDRDILAWTESPTPPTTFYEWPWDVFVVGVDELATRLGLHDAVLVEGILTGTAVLDPHGDLERLRALIGTAPAADIRRYNLERARCCLEGVKDEPTRAAASLRYDLAFSCSYLLVAERFAGSPLVLSELRDDSPLLARLLEKAQPLPVAQLSAELDARLSSIEASLDQ